MNATETTVIVVGAGLAGICVSHYLSRHDIPHLLLEKSNRVGGVWSALDWPGIRCDTEILSYSYSFNPLLSRDKLVSGEEIAAYLESTASNFGVTGRVRFDTRVIHASFSNADHHWHLQTSRGRYRARFLVNANGYFDDRPYIPPIPGRDRYRGTTRHLFEIDRHTNLRGKSVVLVGSGASAVSAAPALAERCRHLAMLQRSPSYIYEDDRRIGWFTDQAQRLYRKGVHFPVKMINWLQQCRSDLVFVAFRKLPWLGRWFFRHHWRNSVDRGTYRAHFQPRYDPWEQRIPVALGFKRLLERADFSLLTGDIESFQSSGLRLTDGRSVNADMIVFATGFRLNFFRFTVAIDDQPVDTRGINFYRSMMMGGLPNYFHPFGAPHTSFTRRVESVSRLIVKIIRHVQDNDLESVWIARREVAKRPRITPGYIMRELDRLPAFYGSLELPSIDSLLYCRFRPKDFHFGGGAEQAGANRLAHVADDRDEVAQRADQHEEVPDTVGVAQALHLVEHVKQDAPGVGQAAHRQPPQAGLGQHRAQAGEIEAAGPAHADEDQHLPDFHPAAGEVHLAQDARQRQSPHQAEDQGAVTRAQADQHVRGVGTGDQQVNRYMVEQAEQVLQTRRVKAVI